MVNPNADDTWVRLASIAGLLHQAATRLWAGPDQDAALQSLGLGIYLTHAHVSSLLPVDFLVPDVDQDGPAPQSALQLLTAAHELTRPLPTHRPDVINTSQLVLDLCDLIREARDAGC